MNCENGTNGTPPTSHLTGSTPPDLYSRTEVAQYVVVVCLAVSRQIICFPTSAISYYILQLCVWDWLLAVSDEVEMIRHINRRVAYILHGLYFIAR